MYNIDEHVTLAHTYAITGHIHGLLEAWLGIAEPPIAEIIDSGAWDRLSPSQKERIFQLFDEIPSEHVFEAIKQAKLDEELTGIPMFEHGGYYWPVFFYQLMLENLEGRNARVVLPKIREAVDRRRVIVLGGRKGG